MMRMFLCMIGLLTVKGQTCPSDVTPPDARGPFYVTGAPFTDRLAPEDQLSDPNQRLVVHGTIYGEDCVPMANILVEPWYAGLPDEDGNEYSVAGSSLQYRAQIISDKCGNYEFTSTFPVSYPGRPIRHIHYRVSDDRELLVTQQYFEGFILSGYNPDASQISSIQTDENGTRRATFDIYVAGSGTANATDCGVTLGPSGPATLTASDPPSNSPTSSATVLNKQGHLFIICGAAAVFLLLYVK